MAQQVKPSSRALPLSIAKGIRQICRNFVVHVLMPSVNFYSARCYVQYRPDALRARRHEILRLQREWEQGTRGNDRGDYTRLYFLLANISALEQAGTPGAFAELGVYKGTTAKVLHHAAPGRDLYLFDTFEGFPEQHASQDPGNPGKGAFACSLNDVRSRLGDSPRIKYCKGIFPSTTDRISQDTTFALVHLDCDLYVPMQAALRFFYPRMSPGGMIIIHDYDSGYWPGVAQAVDEFLSDKPEGLIRIPDKSGTVALVRDRRRQR